MDKRKKVWCHVIATADSAATPSTGWVGRGLHEGAACVDIVRWDEERVG